MRISDREGVFRESCSRLPGLGLKIVQKMEYILLFIVNKGRFDEQISNMEEAAVQEEIDFVKTCTNAELNQAVTIKNGSSAWHIQFKSQNFRRYCKKIMWWFIFTNFIVIVLALPILSIYWGATYRISHFLYKVNVLAVIQDDSTEVMPTLTENLPNLIERLHCTWHIYNASEYQKRRGIAFTEIDKEVINQIYHEDYWMALNVKPNATDALRASLTNSSSEPFNFSAYFQVVYESARDPTNMQARILPSMLELETLFKNYTVRDYLPLIVSNLKESVAQRNLISASNINFDYLDYRPFYNPAILSPLQVGLIYCLLLTFLQLGIYSPLHREMGQILEPNVLISYRILISFATYFILSLFFCTLSAIFRIDFTLAFGKCGFLVYWMTTWLLMIALGGANENVATLVSTVGAQYMGFWLMAWIVLNIAPSFYSMAIHSSFYRYGYIMPLNNALEIFKVIFLDTSKHTLGRNYGVLCAWVAVNTLLFPVIMMVVCKREHTEANAGGTAKA